MSPVKLAVPLPGPFVWMRRPSSGGSPGCLGVLLVVFGLPVIMLVLALAGAVCLLYVLGTAGLILFDETVVMIDDWARRRKASAERRKGIS